MTSTKSTLIVLLVAASLVCAVGCADEATSPEAPGGSSSTTVDGDGAQGGSSTPTPSSGETGPGTTNGSQGDNAPAAGGPAPPRNGDPATPSGDDGASECEGTARLAPSAIGQFGPGTRTTSIEIPQRQAEAAEFGCDTVGSNNGIGLSSLVPLLGVSLSELTQPDPETGEISVIWLGRLQGWSEGQTADQIDDAVLELYQGEQSEDGFSIKTASFVDSNPDNAAQLSFPATIDDCDQVSIESPTFAVTVPVGETNVDIQLSSVKIAGKINAEAAGFSMSSTTISGYLTVSSVIGLLTSLQEVCNGEGELPSLCEQAGQFLNGDPAMLARTIVLPILRGVDSTVNSDGSVEVGCDEFCESDESCECAVSVCLAIETSATTITGISE